jgi:hypothetical protein
MVYTYDISIEVQASIPGSASALTAVNAQILDPTSNTFVSLEVVPSTQRWYVYDVYTRTSSDVAVDGQLVFIKNNVKVLFRTPPLSALIVTNPSRPAIPVMEFAPNDRLNLQLITIAANSSTSAVTDTAFFRARVIDYSL